MIKVLCFDMDGTIANLYGVPDWLPKLRTEDPSPYEDAEPLVDMDALNEICGYLRQAGVEIQIITSLSKDATPEYKEAIREAKRAWLNKWGFIYDRFHSVDYKTPKQEVIRRQMKKEGGEAILIDDEARHTDRWRWGRTIDPTKEDILERLYELLQQEGER